MVFEIIDSLSIQHKSGFLNRYRCIYLKICLVVLTIVSRFISMYLTLSLLSLNTLLLTIIGAGKLLLVTLIIWIGLSSVIIGIDYVFSTFTLNVVVNLVYGFTTFTAFSLFYLTTPPKHVEKLIGFNVFSLTYLFLYYYVGELIELVNTLRARGWDSTHSILRYKYVLRITTVFIVTRINEAVDILRARGVE